MRRTRKKRRWRSNEASRDLEKGKGAGWLAGRVEEIDGERKARIKGGWWCASQSRREDDRRCSIARLLKAIEEESRRKRGGLRGREREEEGCGCGERCVVLDSTQSVMMKLVRERWRGRPRLVGESNGDGSDGSDGLMELMKLHEQ